MTGNLVYKLRELLTVRERNVARVDGHARRPPRSCGFTVHTGYGCPHGCLYCYVPDMGSGGFTKPTPYPLSGNAIAYALSCNERFVAGRGGSLIAVGSVSEPFHPALVGRTMEFLEAVAMFLGNPTQFSTKQLIDEDTADRMASLRWFSISPLITIVTVERLALIEPSAPPIEDRLATIKNLSRAGLRPMVFVRPIIPGITDTEAKKIGELAASNGAVGAVVGTLRVTRGIIERLSKAIDVSPITKRLKGELGNSQQKIVAGDLRGKVTEGLESAGLKVFNKSCAANAYVADVCPVCEVTTGAAKADPAFCRWCPCLKKYGGSDAIPD